MDDVLNSLYRPYLRQQIDYFKPLCRGLLEAKRSGFLVDLIYNEKKNKLYAVVERFSVSYRGTGPRRVIKEKVPVEYLIIEGRYRKTEKNFLGKPNTNRGLWPLARESVEDLCQPNDPIPSDLQEKEKEVVLDLKWDLKISPIDFTKTVTKTRNQKKSYGIQGENNSCYMDATIFSLFSFNNSLDVFVAPAPDTQKIVHKSEILAEEVRGILRSDIISRCRETYFVRRGRMRKLRNIMVREFGSHYQNSYMDVEEFILDLFKLINVSWLFIYDHGEVDYIHQIVLPITWDESQKTDYLTLESLLYESFATSQVKLIETPRSAFIVKLPVSDGKLIPCNGVIPNMTLDLSKIVYGRGYGQKGKETYEMFLHAIICLRSNHFVTFVCMEPRDVQSRWVFMDSKPLTSDPEVHILEGISDIINQAEEDIDIDTQFLSEYEPRINGFKLFRDAYICVYVP